MARRAPWLLLVPLLLAPGVLAAQDTFEIQVYEYATVPRGMWNLETHLNYVANGTSELEGTVAATEHQRHLTFELTRGITDYFEFAGYLVLAGREGHAAEFAGWRLRPRVRFPESWHLPVDISLSAEVGFPQDVYEENSTTLEIRPVLEKRFGRVQADLNPVIGRALEGPGKSEGWDAEPGARLAWAATDAVDVSVEYYGGWRPVSDLFPEGATVHQIFPGVDIATSENAVLNFGIGFGTTDVGNTLVLKMRYGFLFGGS